MKDISVKLILILSILLTATVVWMWRKNVENINVAQTKTSSLRYELKRELEGSTDSVFLKERALHYLNALGESQDEKSRVALEVNTSLVWVIVGSVVISIIATVEVTKRRPSKTKV